MRIAVIGRTEVLYESARHLRDAGHEIVSILTAKEAPEYARTADDFRRLADEWSTPFLQVASISEAYPFLNAWPADIAVSINFTGVIPQTIIDLFPLGILNAHGGDLPRYRGNACQAWAILNGERRVGLCIHRMVGGELDSGDIVARERLPIDENTRVGEILQWIRDRTPSLMLDAVNRLGSDPAFCLERQSHDPAHALRCYPRRPEDGRILWSRTALEVLRLIKASGRPYAGAYCELDGKRLTVWDAARLEDPGNFCAVPGQVLFVGDGWLEVACGSGSIRVHRVAIDGTEVVPSDLIRSIRRRLT